MKVKLLTTFLTTKKWNKAPSRTFFHFAGKGIKKRGGLKPSSGIRAITSLFPTLFLHTSCQLLQKRLILCYGSDCPNISGEWERNDNWMADRLNPFNGIVHIFLQNVKARERKEWKLIAQRFAVHLKTNLSLNKAKITVLLKSVLSFYLRAILSDFSKKYSLRTILCLWKAVLKLHPSIVILLQLSGSFK